MLGLVIDLVLAVALILYLQGDDDAEHPQSNGAVLGWPKRTLFTWHIMDRWGYWKAASSHPFG